MCLHASKHAHGLSGRPLCEFSAGVDSLPRTQQSSAPTGPHLYRGRPTLPSVVQSAEVQLAEIYASQGAAAAPKGMKHLDLAQKHHGRLTAHTTTSYAAVGEPLRVHNLSRLNQPDGGPRSRSTEPLRYTPWRSPLSNPAKISVSF